MAKPHAPRTEKVVGIGFQPGFDPYKVFSTTFVLPCSLRRHILMFVVVSFKEGFA